MPIIAHRLALASTAKERDQALEAVGELSSKTGSLEEQLDKLGRLLKEAQERTVDKARQLQEAEVPYHSVAIGLTVLVRCICVVF